MAEGGVIHETLAQLVRDRRDQLQAGLGHSPRVYIERFQNWGRNQKALVLTVKPKSLSEIQSVIRAAANLELRVRCVGSSHSWSPMFSDEGHICMYMGALQPEEGKPKMIFNQDSMTVTVLGSTTSGELLKFQLENDICLMSNVTLESVHLAGLTAVGCHGAAKDQPCISDYVTEMKIVNSEGELKTYDNSDPQVFKAVQCNLGLFGVVYELTIKVEPMKVIETTSTFPIAKDCMLNPENLMKIARENWCTEIFWFPFNGMSYFDTLMTKVSGRILPGLWDWKPEKDHCWLRTMNKVDIPSMPLPREEDYLVRRGLTLAQNSYIRFLTKYYINDPSNVPGFLKAGVLNILMRSISSNVSEKLPMGIHYDSWVDLCPTTGVEFVFDVNDVLEDYELASNACQIVMDVAKKFGRKGNFPVNITLQIRWTGKSDSFMSPAARKSDNDASTHSFYLCIVSVSGTPSWQNFVNELARRLVKLPKQPHVHWAKQWGDISSVNTGYLRQIYKENIVKFNDALKKTEADPNGMFHNEKLKELIFSDDENTKVLVAENGHTLLGQDEVDGLAGDEADDDVDGDDTFDGVALKKQVHLCKTQESQWQDLCEHFAGNYMALDKPTMDEAKINMHDLYYDGKINELKGSSKSSSRRFLSWLFR